MPHDYACVRVDSRGAGCSPGFIDHFSPRETKDFYDCIEWAGVQPWSNGKVGLNGISYYGINQWHVASLQPPHLAAMCIWEGAADWYRDMTHHGGILSTFWENWYDMQVKTVQYGAGERGKRSRVHGELVCGPETLSEEELASEPLRLRRRDPRPSARRRLSPARSPVWTKVTVPLFSAANWGGQGLHPRGNFEGFVRAASKQKWLEAHGIEHWTHFYTDYGREQQLRFFDHFLHGKDNGWDKQPQVLLQVRHPARNSSPRAENEWPLTRTKWTKFYLDPASMALDAEEAVRQTATLSFDAMGDGLTFLTPPLTEETEITGPSALKLFVSSSTSDADLFHRAARVHRRPEGGRVPGRHRSAHADRARLAARLASQARQEAVAALPALSHARREAAAQDGRGRSSSTSRSGRPRSWCRPGYRIALTIRGKDYEYGGASGGKLSNFKNELTGCGPFLHDDPRDRPPAIFGGTTTLHFGRRQGALPAAADHPAEKTGTPEKRAQIAPSEADAFVVMHAIRPT